jgi:hypothetical protein
VQKDNSSVCDEIDLENAVVEISRRYPLLWYHYIRLCTGRFSRTYCIGISFFHTSSMPTNEGLRAFNIFSYHDRIEYDIPDQVKKFLQYFQVILPNCLCYFYNLVLRIKKGPVD